MPTKAAFAAVLKTIRKARGLSQKNLAQVSSRTYVSKLERGQSSPTLEMMMTLSPALELNPLTLVAITMGAETGKSIRSLINCVEEEISELTQAGVLAELQIPSADLPPPVIKRSSRKRLKSGASAQQIELSLFN